MPSRFQAPTDGWSQSKQRALALFFDQHRSEKFPDGRPWWTYTERPADGAAVPMPVGDLQPHGWGAPWLPESKYMVMSMGSLASNRFRISYERMIVDYRQAWDEYYQRAATEAVAVNLPVPEYGDPLTWKLRAIVGQPPKSPKIPEAALAGDRWLLGFTEEPNEQLERLIWSGTTKIETPREGREAERRAESRPEAPVAVPNPADPIYDGLNDEQRTALRAFAVELQQRKTKGQFKKSQAQSGQSTPATSEAA